MFTSWALSPPQAGLKQGEVKVRPDAIALRCSWEVGAPSGPRGDDSAPAPSLASCANHAQVLAQQELPYKHDGRVELEILVFPFDIAMAFVVGHDEPGGRAAVFKLVQHLPRFRPGHAGIILSYHRE